MNRILHGIVRDLHLYLGLFLSPFVFIFAISVFFLVHAWMPGGTGRSPGRTATEVVIPAGFERLKGREQVDAARTILDRIGIGGEIGFVRHFPRERRINISAIVPGHETVVDLNLESRVATISSRSAGVAESMVYLHKMPGPHNVSIRGNAVYMQVWRWLADATVYVVLFLSVSGVYLWTMIRAERRIGWSLLIAGAGSFGGMVYALVG